jgi:tripartite-type tricarboxylate transporter receptor subunit TctC
LSIRACLQLVVLGVLLGAGVAHAFPDKPVRFIVPFAPGGGNDIIARLIGAKLAAAWGQQVVVDNRPGAGGNLAAETTAHSAPDGHTVFQFNIANAIAPSLYRKLAYDPVADFAPITQLASSPFILVVHPTVQATNVKEFIAFAKSQHGKLNYASSGSGGVSHLLTEVFKTMAGIEMTHIPYNGANPALIDLLSGQVQVLFAVPATSLPLIQSGKLRALGVTSARRSPLAPELPTIAESGVPGFEGAAWYGLVAPAKTPNAIVAQIHRDVVRALRAHDVQERLATLGIEPVGSAPAEFAQFIRSEIPKWAKAVRLSGARVD